MHGNYLKFCYVHIIFIFVLYAEILADISLILDCEERREGKEKE